MASLARCDRGDLFLRLYFRLSFLLCIVPGRFFEWMPCSAAEEEDTRFHLALEATNTTAEEEPRLRLSPSWAAAFERDVLAKKKPTKKSDYEDPGPMNSCNAGEQAAQIQNVKGAFCSPKCKGESKCPPAPPRTTAQPQCCVEGPGSSKPSYCALVCQAGETCPTGATCKIVQGNLGICTYNK